MTPLAKYLDPQVIQQMGGLDLRARFIVEGFLAGLHASPYAGLSVEFSEHRKYVQGDDLRTIDWNVFARTDRLFVRKHEAETHLACHILIDASASMGPVGEVETGDVENVRTWESGNVQTETDTLFRGPGKSAKKDDADTRHSEAANLPESTERRMTKLEYAVHLAAALGYLTTRQQDAIGVGVIGERLLSFTPARARRQHLAALLADLAGVRPGGRTGLATGMQEALSRIPHRGLIVVMSDLLTEPEGMIEALHHVRFRGHDLIVMHILDAVEAHFPLTGTVRLEDPETGQALVTDAAAARQRYLEALGRWRDDLGRRLAGARADYVALDTSMRFDRALVEFLVQRSRRI